MSKKWHKKREKQHCTENDQKPACHQVVERPCLYPSSTQSTTEENQHRTEEKNYWHSQLRISKRLNWITGAAAAVGLLGLVFLYKELGEMQTANTQTKTALHISERAYINIGGPIFDFDKGVVGLPITNAGRIPSGEVETIVHEATVIQADTKALPLVKNTVGKYWLKSRFSSISPGNPINIAMTIRAFSKAQVETGEQIILIAGSVRYNDGFPDDPGQEWPFCMQSVRHLVLKQTILTPCDPKTMIPVLERLDGYPNSEQNAN